MVNQFLRKWSKCEKLTDAGLQVMGRAYLNLGSGELKNWKHPFLAPWGLLFGNGQGCNPQINLNLYSVPRTIVLKIQKDSLTRTSVIAQKSLCRQIDDNDRPKITAKCFLSYKMIQEQYLQMQRQQQWWLLFIWLNSMGLELY